MSHLKEQISALIDGELTGAELDRANAHLAACARCRADAAALRQLKRELRALAASPFDGSTGPGDAGEELTRRLLGMAGPGGPVPSSRFRREQFRRARSDQRGRRPASWRGGAGRAPSGPGDRGARSGALPRHPRDNAQPYSWVRASRPPRRRGRYLLWSAVSLVVVGIGTAAFSMGGSSAEPGPKITPQLQMFSVEHAINSGDVPFPEPTQATTARP